MNQDHLEQAHAPRRGTPLGAVLAVSGAQARVRLRIAAGPGRDESERATVGRFVGIETGPTLLVAVITSVAVPAPETGPTDHAIAQVDLLGEIRPDPARGARFQRGVTHYPMIGDPVRLITADELRTIFDISGSNSIAIGHLQQDATIDACVNVDDMLRKHFAVFGTTGVGKSSGVALILRKVLEARPDQRIFLIDPHNEYGRSFSDSALLLNPRNLKLPFWLFNFEEIVDVFFRARPGVEEEVAILSETIPLAKRMFAASRGAGERALIRKDDPKGRGFTVDTPVPYRLTDLVALIDERMGKLENRSGWTKYHRLITRIETVRNDPRYAFMFDNANVGGDTMIEVLSQLFRLPVDGKPMTIMQLAGFPAEVVDSVVSVLCRMAFDFGLWSDGAAPLLFVCEEAHRYAPADRTIGFGPTRKAISRIAKEGRKYGVYLGLVTQRPAELDATIISQCSTLFAMRMANERDQAIVRAAVSDAAASLLAFVPALGTREVFAFGEGVALPTRMHFKELPAHLVPKGEALSRGRFEIGDQIDRDFIAAVVERWRGATMSQKLKLDERFADDFNAAAAEEFQLVPHTLSLQQPAVRDHDTMGPALESAAKFLDTRAPAPEDANDASARSATTGGRATSFSSDLQELRKRLRSRGGS
ncbi:MAG: ATP-binding protein [Variibacter sp.]|nr:ATP-binding protein [Variibacter sp.]